MIAADRFTDLAAVAMTADGFESGAAKDQAATDRRYLDLSAQVLDIDGLRNITPPTPLIDGYLFQDSLAWLGGKPGHGKTFVAVELACCVSTGTPWHGRTVTQGPVLYLIAEGASGLALRVDAWTLANGRKADNVRFLPVPVRMMETTDVAAFGQLLHPLQPALVILDTQARVTVGAEETHPAIWAGSSTHWRSYAGSPVPASSPSTTSHVTGKTCAAQPHWREPPRRSFEPARTAS